MPALLHIAWRVGSAGYKLSMGRFTDPRRKPPCLLLEDIFYDHFLRTGEMISYSMIGPPEINHEEVLAGSTALFDPCQ
jgi:hypothetical protein